MRRRIWRSRSVRSSSGFVHDEARRQCRVHVDAVGEHRVDRACELLVGGVLHHVSLGAELECLARVGGLVLHREDDHPGAELAKIGDRVEPGPVAQREVEHHDVGTQQAGALERLCNAAGLADDVEPLGRLEDTTHAAADDLMIVDKKGANHAGAICISKRILAPPPRGLES